ncbi:hypothetical protein EK904_003417 [Melospiza melodia maxima]|nr:hypothetical protein EK904_003417 [Melospiza melodia maxima]
MKGEVANGLTTSTGHRNQSKDCQMPVGNNSSEPCQSQAQLTNGQGESEATWLIPKPMEYLGHFQHLQCCPPASQCQRSGGAATSEPGATEGAGSSSQQLSCLLGCLSRGAQHCCRHCQCLGKLSLRELGWMHPMHRSIQLAGGSYVNPLGSIIPTRWKMQRLKEHTFVNMQQQHSWQAELHESRNLSPKAYSRNLFLPPPSTATNELSFTNWLARGVIKNLQKETKVCSSVSPYPFYCYSGKQKVVAFHPNQQLALM